MNDSMNHPIQWAFPKDWIITMQLINDFWVSHAIYVSTKLGIPEILKDGPKQCRVISDAVSADPDSLYRLLHFLACYGIFQEQPRQTFSITAFSKRLMKGASGSLYAWTLLSGEIFYQACGSLLECIKTGKSPTPLYQLLEGNTSQAEIFNEAMAELAVMEDNSFFDDYDFSKVRSIVDIGGGKGGLIQTILRENPWVKGIIFDQESVINRMENNLEEGLQGRCTFAKGDFFAEIPGNGNIYFLRKVLHNWSDEEALKILSNCARAMNEESKLFIIDVVLPCKVPFVGEYLTLNALVIGGRERFQEDFERLLDASGLSMDHIIATKSQNSIVVAMKK